MNQLRILQALGSSSIMCQRLRSNSERERDREKEVKNHLSRLSRQALMNGC